MKLREAVVERDPELSYATWKLEVELELLDPATTPDRRLVLERALRARPAPSRPVSLREVFKFEGEVPPPEFPAEPAVDAPAAVVLAWCFEVVGLLYRWEFGTAKVKPLADEDLLAYVAETFPGMLEVTRSYLEGPRLALVPDVPEPEREPARVASLPASDGLTHEQRALLVRYHLYIEGASRLEHQDRLPTAMEYERLERQRRGGVSRAGRVEEAPERAEVPGEDGLTQSQRDALVEAGRFREGMPAAVNQEILRRAGLA